MPKHPKRPREEKIPRRGGGHVELEPDAEEIFLKSLENMDPRAVKQKLRDEAASQPPTGKEGSERQTGKSAATGSPHTLDLHRMTLVEAQDAVDRFIGGLLTGRGGELTVTIITGKGRHSGEGGGVLAKEIHHYVKRKFGRQIVAIEESPANLVVGELPIRGHFKVVLKR